MVTTAGRLFTLRGERSHSLAKDATGTVGIVYLPRDVQR